MVSPDLSAWRRYHAGLRLGFDYTAPLWALTINDYVRTVQGLADE